VRTLDAPSPARRLDLPRGLRRHRPRSYSKWRWLRDTGRFPDWEAVPAGYLLREAREAAGLSQSGLARRLGCSQQAVARAERWDSNPTLAFLERWAAATGRRVELRLVEPREEGLPRRPPPA
jgi:DNA-binding XRE family transcriptional regulator